MTVASFAAHGLHAGYDGREILHDLSLEIAPGRILVHEEDIVLRADGPELLTERAPFELPEIEI